MSRGHGAIQRHVLDLLFSHSLQPRPKHQADTYLSVFAMADAMTPDDQDYLDVALVESIRRAVKKLEAEGEVETAKIPERRSWSRSDRGTTKRMLGARLPLGDEDTEFYREQAAAKAESIDRFLRRQ
jgi:hypothetical protein